MMTTILLLLLAPAPLPRPALPMEITPGTYTLHWGESSRYHLILEDPHLYEARSTTDPTRWLGSWNWSREERTLVISEALDYGPDRPSGPWTVWIITLDRRLSGTLADRPGVRIRIERTRNKKK